MSPRLFFAVAATALTVDAVIHAVRFDVRSRALPAVVAWFAVAFFAASPTASASLALVSMIAALYSTVVVARRDLARALSPALVFIAFVGGFAAAVFPPIADDFLTPVPASASALSIRVGTNAAGVAPLRIVRVMHAMVLLEAEGERVLTDPWWSTRRHYDAGEALGVSARELESVSLVTSGQDHYDHSDFAALGPVGRATPILVPEGTTQKANVEAAGFRQVTAVRPWETVELGRVRVTAVPARSSVKPTDFDFEVAWVYQLGGSTVLFVGHRLAPEVAAEVARRFGPIDVALVAINDLCVRPQLGKQLSMSPRDAALVVRATGARVAVPIHYRYHGSWLQEALLLSHEGTPDQFMDEVRRVSPSTVVQVLAPGQPLLLTPG